MVIFNNDPETAGEQDWDWCSEWEWGEEYVDENDEDLDEAGEDLDENDEDLDECDEALDECDEDLGTHCAAVGAGEGRLAQGLLDNKSKPGDTGYAGLELLPDGTLVSTTYCVLEAGEMPVVVSVRFTLEEVDAAASLARGDG